VASSVSRKVVVVRRGKGCERGFDALAQPLRRETDIGLEAVEPSRKWLGADAVLRADAAASDPRPRRWAAEKIEHRRSIAPFQHEARAAARERPAQHRLELRTPVAPSLASGHRHRD